MKTEIRNGAVIDIPTVAEITDPINTLLAKLGKNARFIRPIEAGQSDANGAWSVSLGPNDGFLWAVLSVTADPGNTTGTWSLYINSVAPLSLVGNPIQGNSITYIGNKQLILKSNDTLIVQSVAAGAVNHNIGAMLQVIEVPFAHEAQLLM